MPLLFIRPSSKAKVYIDALDHLVAIGGNLDEKEKADLWNEVHEVNREGQYVAPGAAIQGGFFPLKCGLVFQLAPTDFFIDTTRGLVAPARPGILQQLKN